MRKVLGSANWASFGLRVQLLLSGFVIIALEILGGRLITSTYGNSYFAWGSLIGVVLAGLATGYHYGGKLADKSPSHEKFSSIVLTGGLLIVLIPFITPYGLALSLSLGYTYGPLLASILILLLPTAVLGTTSPYAIKLATQSLAGLGRVAGNLYSLSTVGSIMGAFGATFVLIPLLDLRTIIFSLGLALMLVALLWLPRLTALFPALVLLTLLTPLSSSLSSAYVHSGAVIFEKETPYSHLDVVETGTQRTLYLNGLPQSAMDLSNSTRLVFTYTRYFHIGLMVNPEARNVLFVGGGGFSGPKNFLATYPNVQVDVVELDPDVIQTAENYFDVRPDTRLNIHNIDARVYLTQNDKSYDLVVLDAYAKTYVPFHLMTKEFMELLYSRLSPQGIVISNLIGSLVGDTSDLVRAEYKTITTVFPNTVAFPTSGFSIGTVQNIMLVFAKSTSPPLTETSSISQEFTSHMYRGLVSTEDVPLLTDGYAPVESLLNPVTGRSYSIEQEFGRLTPTILGAGQALFAFTIILFIAVSWFAYLARRML